MHRPGKREQILCQLDGGPEDRLLPRPARQPRRRRTPLRGPYGPEPFLLHGRFFDLRPCRRRPPCRFGRQFPQGDGHGGPQCRHRRFRSGAPYFLLCRCHRFRQECARREIRPDDCRSAGVRQASRRLEKRPPGLPAPECCSDRKGRPRRFRIHVQLLAGGGCRGVCAGCFLRCRRDGPQRADPRPDGPAR